MLFGPDALRVDHELVQQHFVLFLLVLLHHTIGSTHKGLPSPDVQHAVLEVAAARSDAGMVVVHVPGRVLQAKVLVDQLLLDQMLVTE